MRLYGVIFKHYVNCITFFSVTWDSQVFLACCKKQQKVTLVGDKNAELIDYNLKSEFF